MIKFIKSLVDHINALLYALMIIVVFIQVVFRYVFNRPLTTSEEIARYIFIWLVMLGSAAAMWDRDHISLTFLLDKFPKTIKKILLIAIDILVAILIYLVLVKEGLNITRITMNQISPATGISIGWIYISLPVSGILMLLALLFRIIFEIVKFKSVTIEMPKEIL